MVRGWIRGKASRQGKKSQEIHRSQKDLNKIIGCSVYDYHYDVYGDGEDDYDEEWLDNWNDLWLQQQKPQKKSTYFLKTKRKTPASASASVSPSILTENVFENYTYSISEHEITPQPLPTFTPTPPPTPKRAKPIKNGLIEDIKMHRNEKEQKEYITAGEQYVSRMAALETYATYSSIEGLTERHTYSSHKDDKPDPTSDNFKKIMKEIRKTLPKNIYTSIECSMFVRFDENNPRFLQALLTGIEDTPYANGLFLFDIYLPDDYPNKPLNIKHVTRGAALCRANNGPGGFSPNLHQSSGKVCLSLLGTWSGPGWTAGQSNVYQVLSTILFMIFGANHPYYMEPSHGGWEGTVVGRTQHERRVIDYDEEVMFHNAKSAILDILKKPYVGFEDVVKTHFKIKAPFIVSTIQQWMDHTSYTDAFKNKMKPVFKEIKAEFAKLD